MAFAAAWPTQSRLALPRSRSMALGRMPPGTKKLVKRIHGLAAPRYSGADELARRVSRSSSFAQLTEDDRKYYLPGRRSRGSGAGSLRHSESCRATFPRAASLCMSGRTGRRYVISTSFLTHALLKQLLKKTEEYGSDYEGELNVVCDISLVEHLLWLIYNHQTSLGKTRDLEDVVDSFYKRSFRDEPKCFDRYSRSSQ